MRSRTLTLFYFVNSVRLATNASTGDTSCGAPPGGAISDPAPEFAVVSETFSCPWQPPRRATSPAGKHSRNAEITPAQRRGPRLTPAVIGLETCVLDTFSHLLSPRMAGAGRRICGKPPRSGVRRKICGSGWPSWRNSSTASTLGRGQGEKSAASIRNNIFHILCLDTLPSTPSLALT